MQSVLNVGVDVAKDTVVVACAEQHFPVHEIRNQRTALRTWLKSLPAGSRLGLESTNTYHEVLADLAHAHGPNQSLETHLRRLSQPRLEWHGDVSHYRAQNRPSRVVHSSLSDDF